MKLKNKLYLTQFFLILTLSIFLWVLYGNLKEHSQNDLERELTKSININTLLLTSALEDTYTILEQNKNIIKRIHRVAIDELKKDENISLDHLKTKMRSLFNLQYVGIDFYIINKEYEKYGIINS